MKAVIPIIGFIGVIVLGSYLVSTQNFPSLGEFIASSTNQIWQRSATSSENSTGSSSTPVQSYSTTTIGTPRDSIEVEIANNPTKRDLGLGGRRALPSGTGMLFIFPEPGKYGFWMKDMNFPIDIVWIRSDRKIVDVTDNVSPATYPEIFHPPSSIQFVLELNAGESARQGIVVGDYLAF